MPNLMFHTVLCLKPQPILASYTTTAKVTLLELFGMTLDLMSRNLRATVERIGIAVGNAHKQNASVLLASSNINK